MERNKQMHAIIEEENGSLSTPSVAIIESAYKPFLSREVTYNVAHYTVTGEESEDLWALKKTPASKHEDLLRYGTAIIVVNDKTGEVLDFQYVNVNCDH